LNRRVLLSMIHRSQRDAREGIATAFYISIYLCIYQYISISLSLFLSFFLSIYLSIYLSTSLYNGIYVYIYIYTHTHIYLYPFLHYDYHVPYLRRRAEPSDLVVDDSSLPTRRKRGYRNRLRVAAHAGAHFYHDQGCVGGVWPC